MNLFALSGLLAGINSFAFGVFSWVKGKKSLNKIWAIFNLSVAIWGFGAYKFSTTLDKSAVFFWLRFGHIGVILIPVLFIHFVFELLEEKRRNLIYLIYGVGLFFSILNITDWLGITKVFIVSLRFVFNSFYVDCPPGPVYPLFVAFFFGAVIYAHLRALKHLKFATGLKRMQIKYFLAATALGFGGGGTAFPMVFNINIYPLLHFTVCLYPIIMTYTIFKYRLMDIDLVLRGWLIFLPYAVISVVAFVVLNVLFYKFPWINKGGIILVILSAPFIYQYLLKHSRRVIDSTIYKNKFTYIENLEDFMEEMPSIFEKERLFKDTASTLAKGLWVDTVSIFIHDTRHRDYLLKTQIGLDRLGDNFRLHENGLTEWLKVHKTVFVKEEMEKTLPKEKFTPIHEAMINLNASVCVPVMFRDDLVGFITLGEKKSREMYSHIDTRLLHRLGVILATTLDLREKETRLRDQQAMGYIMTMAKELSHQLRNRLATTQTYFDLLPQRQNDPAFRDEFRKLAMNDINVLTHKLTEMMFFANLEKPRPKYSPLDIIITAALLLAQKRIREKNIEIHKEIEKNLPQMFVDEEVITSTISNIIDNAAGAAAESGGRIVISANLLHELSNDMKKKSGQWIRIIIKDNGCGMSKDTLGKIFEPFFTTRSGGTEIMKMGFGLGLVISKMIVDAHGGSIIIDSEENKGTTVTMDLPIANKDLLEGDYLPPEGVFHGKP